MRKLSLLVLAILAAGTAALGSVGGLRPDQETQILQHRTGIPLATVIAPVAKQDVVVVEKNQTPPLFITPLPGVGDVEFRTSISTVVVIVQISGLESTLIPPVQDWVATKVTARIQDVLRKPTGDPITVGDSVSFKQDGGDVRIGPTTVRAVLPYADAFLVGQRYLLFGLRNPDDSSLIFGPTDAYRLGPNDNLIPLAKVGPNRSIGSVRLGAAIARIRSVK